MPNKTLNLSEQETEQFDTDRFNQVIRVTVRNTYGVDRVYPTNVLGQKLAQLVNRRTFTPEDIRILKSIGYKFEMDSPISPMI